MIGRYFKAIYDFLDKRVFAPPMCADCQQLKRLHTWRREPGDAALVICTECQWDKQR